MKAGVYRGIVYANDDPDGRHRLRVIVPQVFGLAPTGWLDVCVDVTTAPVLAVDAPCLVMFEAGDPDYPLVIGTWKVRT